MNMFAEYQPSRWAEEGVLVPPPRHRALRRSRDPKRKPWRVVVAISLLGLGITTVETIPLMHPQVAAVARATIRREAPSRDEVNDLAATDLGQPVPKGYWARFEKRLRSLPDLPERRRLPDLEPL